MSDNADWLSEFDPDNPTFPGGIEIHPVDISVVGDELIVTDSASQQQNLSKYSGSAGTEQVDIVMDVDGSLNSVTTEGSTLVGKLKRTSGTAFQYVGTGFYNTSEVTASKGDFLVQIPATFIEEALTNSLTVEGVRYSVLNIYNGFYSVAKLLNGTANSNSDGMLWANGTPLVNVYVHVEFPEVVEIGGFLMQNMRADYTIKAGVIEVKDGNGDWTPFYAFDVTATLLDLNEFIFDSPVFVSEIRLRATDRGNNGALGRLEFFKNNPIATGTLIHKPLTVDITKFDITETTDSIQLALKASSGGAGGFAAQLPLLATDYFRAEVVQAGSLGFGHKTVNVPRIHPINNIVRDFVGIRVKAGAMLLPIGTYRYKLTAPHANGGTILYYLADMRTSTPITNPHSARNTVTSGASVNVHEGGFVVSESMPVTVSSVATVAGDSILPPSSVPGDMVICSIELWKVSDELLIHSRPPVSKPAEVSETLPMLVIDASLGTGDGRGLDDGNLTIAWNNIENTYWSAAGHYLTAKFDHDFRLWRYPNADYPTRGAVLRIERIGPVIEDFSHLSYGTTSGTLEWFRFTDTLPPGTYKFTYSAPYRMDTEWCVEKMPWGSGGPFPRGQLVVQAMSSDSGPGQTSSASSTYTGYPAWKAFNRVVGDAVNSGWASTAKPTLLAPQWLQITFTSSKTINAYSLKNRSYPTSIQSPRTWELQGSNDGSVWDTLHSVVDYLDNVANYEHFFILPQNYTYDRYRIFITDANDNSLVVIEEMQLYYKE